MAFQMLTFFKKIPQARPANSNCLDIGEAKVAIDAVPKQRSTIKLQVELECRK